MGTKYFKNNRGLSMARGNLKIGTDTLILNMGSAEDCPSRKRGLCKVGNKCYARKAECLYPAVLPSRRRCQQYWLENTSRQIADDIIELFRKHKKALRHIKYIRFNESGDFHSQRCVTKLDRLSSYLHATLGLTVYGYTARKDLDFSRDLSFSVKGSGWKTGNNGHTIVRKMNKLQTEVVRKNGLHVKGTKYTMCPGDCSKCDLCKVRNNTNIVFKLH